MGSILKSVRGQKPRIMLGNHFVDAAGNIFIGTTEYTDQNRYNGEVHIYKLDVAGRFTEVAVRQPIEGKGDTVSIAQTGPHISVLCTVHVSDPQSDLQLLDAVRDVAVPYPAGRAPLGAPGAYLGETEGEPVPVDYERIQAMLDDHRQKSLASIVAAFGGNIRQGIYDKCKQACHDALREAGVVTVANIQGVLYQFTLDRQYQVFADNVPGFWPWLRDKVAGK